MAVILAVNMLVIGIFGSYQTAQAAEIVAGYTAGQILESILLGFGISIFTTEMVQKGTIAAWWDTDGSAALKPYYDDLEQAYEKQRFKVINGGGGQNPEPSPTPAPGNTPIPFPTTVPVPGDIPTFKELVAPALVGTAAVINMTQGAWECMGKAVSSLWDKIFQEDPSITYKENPYSYKDLIGSYSITFNCSQLGGFKGTYTYYLYKYNKISHLNLTKYTTSEGYSLHNVGSDSSGLYFNTYSIKRHDYVGREPYISALTGRSSRLSITLPDKSSNVVENINLYVPYTMDGVDYDAKVKPMNKSGIWPSTDLKNDYDKNKSPSIPATAPAPAIKIPSLDNLKDLQNRGNNANDDERPSIILDWLKNHYTNPSTDPNPKPDPDPNPDPKPDPDPNPDPNPDPDPDLNPTPTTAPKPDDENTDVNPDDYKADLRLVFPFCIPFDLVHLIQAFEAEPEAPVFEFPFDLELENPWTGKKILDYHHVFKLDMSDYEPVIKIFRIFEIIFFIIGLLMITRQQMIKG